MTFAKFFHKRKHTGRIWVLGDNVNSEIIHPARFFSVEDKELVKQGFLYGHDPQIQPQMQSGDIILAGVNYGCGSSREVSSEAAYLNGVAAIIAESFARIQFRNLTNQGILALETPNLRLNDKLETGSFITIDLENYLILDNTNQVEYPVVKPSYDHLSLLEKGGLKNILEPKYGTI